MIHVYEPAAWKRLYTLFMRGEEICCDDCPCESLRGGDFYLVPACEARVNAPLGT